jgi:RNA polymerase sigma-70 factor (ECF subfamily)
MVATFLSLPLNARPDMELVDLTLAGHPRAFEVLVRRYRDRVYGIAMGMTRRDCEAQDVVQETFLAAFRKLHTWRRESPFRGWLLRIASNASLMRLRGRRRRPEVSLELGGHEDEPRQRQIEDRAPLADQLMQDEQLGARLREAIGELPEKYRSVLEMADFEHLSMREIAETSGLSVPAVKTRLHRARLSVRRDLELYLEGRA